MSEVWWGKESQAQDNAFKPDSLYSPRLVRRSGRTYIRQNIASLIPGYTPEWTQQLDSDAGYALVKLFSELAEPVVARLNRLPEKAFIEFLRTASQDALSEQPARTNLTFTVSKNAPRSVAIRNGFQCSAAPADGTSGRVTFETDTSIYAVPGKISETYIQSGTRFHQTDLDSNKIHTDGVAIFSQEPFVGAAILLGFDCDATPTHSMSIELKLLGREGVPLPVAIGRDTSASSKAHPLLRWEYLDGGTFIDAEVIRDQTESLSQTGIVELRLPKRWSKGTPEGMESDNPLRWLRLRYVFGEFSAAPLIAHIALNTVQASAVRTIRNEVLEYVPDSDRRKMRLSQSPILKGSLELLVREGEFSVTDNQIPLAMNDTSEEHTLWTEVDDLNGYAGDKQIYTLDTSNGELLFGDGKHGAKLPRGFRHVIAKHYQVASGAAGAVAKDEVTGLISSLPFLVGVTNLSAASGGRDGESVADTLQRAPKNIRARGRAVTLEDYNIFATQIPGTDIRRAHAVSGVHAALGQDEYSGVLAQVPGVVSVFVVNKPNADDSNRPPYPDTHSLRNTAEYLLEHLAPAGIEVVAAAPYFHDVAVRAKIVVRDNSDISQVIRDVLSALDTFFDPLIGGESGQGWPFGGLIKYDAVVRYLLRNVPLVTAIQSLNLIVDGQAQASCNIFMPRPHSLLWPSGHEIQEA